ncbi:hypothetical protein CRENBAI_010199 [Crenichthys baileyi]|uniref:Uncharacterized protein n=1 Tax=Crenichthys baileyi TaxID=28760 RepID=A0AAV9R4T4_9TELE
MEFWLENQGQSQLYSRFGTLPGRNCAHNYHDRHQATYNTPYYGEQQDQGRESSEWTVSGPRAGGTLQEYTNWTEPELPSSSSPNFPFILHRHDQRHQDLGDYRQHDPRDKEWASNGPLSEYHRGFLRDAWQKRWDQSHPSRYREVSAKRNDSSYRELEAWAARYSHSLPRRRRLEAELREAVRGLSESSQAPEREKPVTNPRVQLQHGQLNPNRRASGLWDKKAPPATDTNHIKEKIGYQSRVSSKPPGYIGPPPYNRPLKSPPVTFQRDDGWHPVGKKQADWSQPTLRKQDVLVDLQTQRKMEKDEIKTYPEMVELESSKHEGDDLQVASPIDAQKPDSVLAHETQAVKNSNMEKEEICTVIEGRKFRLKKKTGGMTIFCLVSRIASPSETTSLPVCTSQTSIQSTETDRKDNNQVNKLADDVDFSSQALKEQMDKKTLGCREKVMPEDDLPNTANGFERGVLQSVQPVLTKYPLWREPSSSSKAETENSNTNCLKERKGSILNQDEGGDVSSQSTDNEKKKLDITDKAEDMRGLLVIDTSCVVVKVKLIPSPKKEQVHYLGSRENDESSSSESNSMLSQVTTDPSIEALKRNEDPEADLDPTLLEKQEQKESGVSLSSVQQSLVSERETLEERAKRILGIPLHGAVIEQQTENEEPLIDLCKEEQNEEAEPHPSEQTLEDTADHVEVPLAEKDEDDIRKQLANKDGKDFTDSQQQASDMTEDDNTESRLETDKTSTQTELKKDSGGESPCGGSKNEKQLVDLNNSSLLSLNVSDSSIQEGLDSEIDAQSADVDPHPDTSFPPVQPSPLFPEFPDSPLSSTLSEDNLPSPPPLEVMLLAADVECVAKHKDDEGETSHSAESGVNHESLVTEKKDVLPHQHSDCHQWDDDPCITEKQQTDEADSSRAETKDEDLNIIAQQLSCVQTEGVTCAKEEQEPLVANGNLSDLTVQTDEENEENARTCKTEDYCFLPKSDLEEDVLCKKERGVTLEQTQINPGLTASLFNQTGSNERDTGTQTPLKTDNLQNSESQGKCPDYTSSSSSGSEVLISDFSSPSQEPDRDYDPLLETDSTGSTQNVDITAAPDVENVSSPFYLDSWEESSQLSTVLPQEEDVSTKFSPSAAHKKTSQYPKSLLDVVSRIRKHTAPDSESEEEEVSEQWDPSCPDVVADIKSQENFSDVVLNDSAETRQVDQDDKEPEGHAEEESTAEQQSSSSHISEDTVIVVGGETRLPGEADKEQE